MSDKCINIKNEHFLGLLSKYNLSSIQLELDMKMWQTAAGKDVYNDKEPENEQLFEDYLQDKLKVNRPVRFNSNELSKDTYLNMNMYKALYDKYNNVSYKSLETATNNLSMLERAVGKDNVSIVQNNDNTYRICFRNYVDHEGYTSEERQILENAPRNAEGKLLATNGKVSNLTEKQYAQVRTKAFKEWFGDWEKANLPSMTFMPKKHWTIGHRINTPSEAANICDNTQIKVLNKLIATFGKPNTRGQYYAKPVTIWAKSPINDKQINHEVVVVRINGEVYIYDMPQTEFIKQVGFNDGEVIKEYSPRLIKYTEENLISEYGTDKELTHINDESILDSDLLELPLTNASKVVDENGEPLVVYHGSVRTTDKASNIVSVEYFATPDIEQASSYTGYKTGDSYSRQDYIRSVYMNIKNPLILDNKGKPFYETEYKGEIISSDKLIDIAKKEGYDGFMLYNTKDYGDNIEAIDPSKNIKPATFAVFNTPNQIKSATDNNGDFSSIDDNIYKSHQSETMNTVDRIKIIQNIVNSNVNNSKLNGTAKGSGSNAYQMNNRWGLFVDRWRSRGVEVSGSIKDGKYIVSDVKLVDRDTYWDFVKGKGNLMDVLQIYNQSSDPDLLKKFGKATTNSINVLNRIKSNNHNLAYLIELLTKRDDILKNVDIKLVSRGQMDTISKGAAAAYDPKSNSIFVDRTASFNGNNGLVDYTIIHEIFHAIVFNTKLSETQTSKLDSLYNEAVSLLCNKYNTTKEDLLKNRVFYGLTSRDEFLSEAISNQQFLEELGSIGEQGESIIDKVISFVASVIKSCLGVKNNSKIQNETLNLIDDILKTPGITSNNRLSAEQQSLANIESELYNNDDYLNYLAGLDMDLNQASMPADQTSSQQTINDDGSISSNIQKHQGNWSRLEAQNNPRTLYVFTDNTDRDSGFGVIPANSWYSQKYGEGHHFPTRTAAVIRGLDNARPISTQRWYHQGAKGTTGRWTDADVEEFSQVIEAELQDIVEAWNSGNYDTIMFPDGDGLFNTTISNITMQRTPALYKALSDLLNKYGFNSLIPQTHTQDTSTLLNEVQPESPVEIPLTARELSMSGILSSFEEVPNEVEELFDKRVEDIEVSETDTKPDAVLTEETPVKPDEATPLEQQREYLVFLSKCTQTYLTAKANYVMCKLSDILDALNTDPNAVHTFLEKSPRYSTYANADFTILSRDELKSNFPSLLNDILDYIKEYDFNTESGESSSIQELVWEDLDDPENASLKVRKERFDEIYNNWEGFLEYGNRKLSELEGWTISAYDPNDNSKATDITDSMAEDAMEGIESSAREEKSRENWQLGFRQISAVNSLSQQIKSVLGKLFLKNPDGTNMQDEDGQEMYVNSATAVNMILECTRGCTTMEEMEKALTSKKKVQPWLGQILDKIKEEPLRSKFFSGFRKEFTTYSTVEVTKDENGNLVWSVNMCNVGDITKTAISELQDAAKSGDLFYIHTKGDRRIIKTDAELTEEDKARGHISVEALRALYNDCFTNGYFTGTKENVVRLLSHLSIQNVTEAVAESLISELKGGSINGTKLGTILDKANYIIKILENVPNGMIFNNEKDTKSKNNSLRNEYKAIFDNIKEYLITDIEASVYNNGKMYYSYTTPSYAGKLFDRLSNVSGKSEEDYMKMLEKEYGQYEWFKKDGTWRNSIIKWLAEEPKKRQLFQHKTQLTFGGIGYTDLSELSYKMSMLAEYLYDNSGNYGWYRVPMLSNKPSSEFVKMPRYTDLNVITENMKDVVLQEIDRIKAVLTRANDARVSKIKSFDIKNSKDKDKQQAIDNAVRKAKAGNLTAADLVYKGEFLFLDSGASFKFLPPLNDYIKNNTELGNLIVDYLNGKNVTDDAFREVFKPAFESIMKGYVKHEIDEWRSKGLFAKDDKGKYIHLSAIVSDDTLKRKTDNLGNPTETVGEWEERVEKEAEEILKEYTWNDMLASTNIIQLTVTDLAYYKDVVDFQKRFAQIHSPSMKFNVSAEWNGKRVSDGKQRTMYVKDLEISADDIIKKVEGIFNKKISEAKDTGTKKSLEITRDSIVAQFKNVNVADAQGYTSPTSFRKRAIMMGEWSNKQEEAYNRIIKGNFTTNDLGILWQPTKPFMYGQTTKLGFNENLNKLKVPVQNKNSEYMLFLADAIIRGAGERNTLTALFDFMEDSHYNGKYTLDANGNHIHNESDYVPNGIDTIQFESAVKSGLHGVFDIHNEDKMREYFTNKDISTAGLTKSELIYKYLSEVYNTDEHGNHESNADTQSVYDDRYVDEMDYEDYGIQQPVPDHFADHEQLIGSQERILSISDITPGSKFFYGDYTKGDRIAPIYKDYRQVQEEYQQLLADNIHESVRELERELNINGDKSARTRALSKVLVKAIKNDNKYSADLAWACSVHQNDNGEWEFNIPLSDPIQGQRVEALINSIIKSNINKQKIKGGPVVQASCFGFSEELEIKWNKAGTHVEYFPCYLPIPSEDLEKALMKEDGSFMTLEEAVENKVLSEAAVAELTKAIGYRIPTEDKYSIAPLKIVGFVPKAAGQVVVLPKEITRLSGSDFDIDKMYIMLKSYTVKENPNGDTKYSVISDNRYTGEKATREGRNNRIIDIQYSVLTHEDTMDKMFNPGGFEELSKIAGDIDKLTGNNAGNLNILLPSTQSYFHSQNMVAGKLIGVFANNNTAHAFINMYPTEMRIDVPFNINGKDIGEDGYVSIDNAVDFNGNRISKNLASYLAASVDAVKDPVLNHMNINMVTVNVAMTLARIGITPKTIALIMAQPVMREVVQEYQTKSDAGYTTIEECIDTVAKRRYNQVFKDNSDSIVAALKNPITDKNLESNFSTRDGNTDISVLALFYSLQDTSKKLGELTFCTKFNSVSNAVGPRIANNLKMQERVDALYPPESDLGSYFKHNKYVWDNESKSYKLVPVDNIMECSPLLKAFYDSTVNPDKSVTSKLFKDDFIYYSGAFREVLNYIASINIRSLSADDIIELANDFMLYSMTSGNIGFLDSSEEGRQQMMVEFPKEFIKWKKDNPDNALAKAISYGQPSKKAKYNMLVLNSNNNSPAVQDEITNAWADLYADTGTRKLAENLFKYSILRGGFNYLPQNFIHLTPLQVKLGSEEYINAISSFNNPTGPTEFFLQFARNHATNSKFVIPMDDIPAKVGDKSPVMISVKGVLFYKNYNRYVATTPLGIKYNLKEYNSLSNDIVSIQSAMTAAFGTSTATPETATTSTSTPTGNLIDDSNTVEDADNNNDSVTLSEDETNLLNTIIKQVEMNNKVTVEALIDSIAALTHKDGIWKSNMLKAYKITVNNLEKQNNNPCKS